MLSKMLLTKLFFDIKKTAFDFKQSNALTKLSDANKISVESLRF